MAQNWLSSNLDRMEQPLQQPSSVNYHNYGGRGITIYEDWDDRHNHRAFETFASWVLEHSENARRAARSDRNDNDWKR